MRAKEWWKINGELFRQYLGEDKMPFVDTPKAMEAYAADVVRPAFNILSKLLREMPDCESTDENSDHCACAIFAVLGALRESLPGLEKP